VNFSLGAALYIYCDPSSARTIDMMESVNPATGGRIKTFDTFEPAQIETALDAAANAAWRASTFAERARLLRAVAAQLRAQLDLYAGLITLEMGKLAREARAEIEKCAVACEYFARHGEAFLRDEPVETEATKSYVAYQPLGTLLAIMPWNFPFWQAFRAAVPALMAGNTVLLKHASNVPQCALAIERAFIDAGFPPGVFRTLLISGVQAEKIIADPRVHAVTITGSEAAGRKVGAAAGAHLKKIVLELGGSDAFVVLDDADLDRAVAIGALARMQNCGQSCIAAKRFILVDSIAEKFLQGFSEKLRALTPGDPQSSSTTLAPMAREDLRDELHKQVQDSVRAGATLALEGGPIPGAGFFYRPAILDRVQPGMRAYTEELFGPVAIVIRARDEADALRIANDHSYGLGASVWTRDAKRGERFARELQAGGTFVNAMVRSDARVPFGGIKASGHGRELAIHGIREFTNVKTVWIE
jgi:succinate-semialdehyde dehydrogenase/glutarate-semialdehyde dehydrogenase